MAVASAAVAAGLVLSACAGQTPVAESARAKAVLGTDVSRVASTAEAHHEAAALRALAQLRRDVADLESEGQLSTSVGNRVLDAASGVQGQLYLLGHVSAGNRRKGTTTLGTSSTSTTSTTTATPTTQPHRSTPSPTTNPPGPPGPGPGGGNGGQDHHGGGDAGKAKPGPNATPKPAPAPAPTPEPKSGPGRLA